jgi:hypothetical protein
LYTEGIGALSSYATAAIALVISPVTVPLRFAKTIAQLCVPLL